MTVTRVLRAAEATGILLGVILIGMLHLIPPTRGIDPVSVTISEYGRSPLAAVFVAAVVLIAAGSAATLVLLVRAGTCRAWSLPAIGLALWVVGMVGVAAFQKADWAAGATLSGYTHRAASLLAFIALPIAVLALSAAARRRLVDDRRALTVALGLAATVLAAMAVLGVFIGIAEARGLPWWTMMPLGLTERAVVAVELVALALLVVALRRTPTRATPIVSDRAHRTR